MKSLNYNHKTLHVLILPVLFIYPHWQIPQNLNIALCKVYIQTNHNVYRAYKIHKADYKIRTKFKSWGFIIVLQTNKCFGVIFSACPKYRVLEMTCFEIWYSHKNILSTTIFCKTHENNSPQSEVMLVLSAWINFRVTASSTICFT